MIFFRVSVFFFMLLIFYPKIEAQNMDIDILRSINQHRPVGLDGSCKLISKSVTPLSILMPASLLIAGKITDNNSMFKNGLKSGTAIVVAVSMATILKYGVNRERPYSKYPDIEKLADDFTPSFPSGHTTSAFCAATSLSLMYPKWYVVVSSYSWAAAVGYSRLHMGMHYPSDVIAGAILGSLSAFISFKVQKWIGQ
jgi:membrane-associated phospholipid phosphatase